MEDLKDKAKALGLWNMFLAKGHFKEGAGFTNLEYGLMCEQFGFVALKLSRLPLYTIWDNLIDGM